MEATAQPESTLMMSSSSAGLTHSSRFSSFIVEIKLYWFILIRLWCISFSYNNTRTIALQLKTLLLSDFYRKVCCLWESAPSWSEWVFTTNSVNWWWTEWRQWTAPMMSCSSAQVDLVLCLVISWFSFSWQCVGSRRLGSGFEGHSSAQRSWSESGDHSGADAGLSGILKSWSQGFLLYYTPLLCIEKSSSLFIKWKPCQRLIFKFGSTGIVYLPSFACYIWKCLLVKTTFFSPNSFIMVVYVNVQFIFMSSTTCQL